MSKSKILSNPWVVAVLALFCAALWGSATPFIKIGYELIDLLGLQHFAAEPSPHKLLCGHAVVVHKAHCRKGSGTEDAHPRNRLRSHIGFQNKVQKHRNANSQ